MPKQLRSSGAESATDNTSTCSGLQLPGVPRDTLCTFSSHRSLYASATSRIQRQACLVTGCSVWRANNGVPPARGDALSTPLSVGLQCYGGLSPKPCSPTNRLPERPFCTRAIRDPTPPVVIDFGSLCEEVGDQLSRYFESHAEVFVATDGSAHQQVAALGQRRNSVRRPNAIQGGSRSS